MLGFVSRFHHANGTSPTSNINLEYIHYKYIVFVFQVCQSDVGESVKARNMSALSNIIELESVPQLIAKHSGVKVIVNLIGKGIKAIFISGTNIIRAICLSSTQLASKVNDAGFIAIAMKLMATPEKLNVQSISNVVLAVGYMSKVSEHLQTSIGSSGIFQSFKYIFDHGDFQSCIPLLTALTKAISGIVADNPANQNLCIEADLATSLIMVSRATKHRDLQTAAIDVSEIVIYILFIHLIVVNFKWYVKINNPYLVRSSMCKNGVF